MKKFSKRRVQASDAVNSLMYYSRKPKTTILESANETHSGVDYTGARISKLMSNDNRVLHVVLKRPFDGAEPPQKKQRTSFKDKVRYSLDKHMYVRDFHKFTWMRTLLIFCIFSSCFLF